MTTVPSVWNADAIDPGSHQCPLEHRAGIRVFESGVERDEFVGRDEGSQVGPPSRGAEYSPAA
jgi:hypothetical protein